MGTRERRANEKQIRLDQILNAARSLLFSEGITNISISKIAAQAELGVGTIYFYFTNKEEIFIALQEEGLSLFYSIIRAIHRKPVKSDEKLNLIAKEFYRFTQEHKDYYDIINYFLSSSREFFQPDLKNQIDMSGSKILSLIEKIVQSGIADHTFQKDDAGKFAIFFFSSLFGLMQMKKLEKTALASERHMDIYEYSVKKLIHGLKQTTCL